MASVKGVEIFQAGKLKGKTYRPEDLDDIVQNFKDFSTGPEPLVRLPVVIGHEEEQELLKNTGVPKSGHIAAMYVETIPCRWCEGSGVMKLSERSIGCPCCEKTGKQVLLRADLDDIPDEIADLIDKRAYDQVSFEIYDSGASPEQVPAKGMMGRRLALLGGELPHVKSLADMPKTTRKFASHSESNPIFFNFHSVRYSQQKTFTVFSEVIRSRAQALQNAGEQMPNNIIGPEGSGAGSGPGVSPPRFGEPMNRDAIIQALVQRGGNSEALQAMTDDQLQMIQTLCGGGGAGGAPGGTEYMWDDDKDKATPEDKEGAKLFWEKCKKMSEYGKKKFGETSIETGGGANPAIVPQNKPSESMNPPDLSGKNQFKFSEEVKSIVNAAVAQAVANVKREFDPLKKDIVDFRTETHRAGLTEFCENQVKLGRIAPSEMDRTSGKPNLLDQLMMADAVSVVHKFSEGGKSVSMTALDVAKSNIMARPVGKFSEKAKSQGGKPAKKTDITPDEEAALTGYWNSFSESYHDLALTTGKGAEFGLEDVVAGYKAAKANDHTLTVQTYLNTQ